MIVNYNVIILTCNKYIFNFKSFFLFKIDFLVVLLQF